MIISIQNAPKPTDTPQSVPFEKEALSYLPEISWSGLAWARIWPVLIWVLTPLLAVARTGLVLYTRAYIRLFRDNKISLKAKCPSCGHRATHTIEYILHLQSVVHKCAVCKAMWMVATIYNPKQWAPKPEQEPPASSQPIAVPLSN